MTSKTFAYHELTEDQLGRMEVLRDAFSTLESQIKDYVKDGRYKSLALTTLEETAMWCMKAIGHEE